MKIHILLVPFDSGNRSLRMGAGPQYFLENGLPEVLQANGHQVTSKTVEPQTEFRAKVKTQFELYRALATRVAETRRNNAFPLILSGNCGATLGVLAGSGARELGVVWFDAHGEFNTPETTTSGFLDGMGLAIATGVCWKRLATSIPGFRPIPGNHILHVGGRDFDAGEMERLEQAGVMVVDAAALEQRHMQAALQPAMAAFQNEVAEVHLHIDLDVLHPTEAPVNEYSTGDAGLRVEKLKEAIGFIKETMKISSATIASFDPAYDPHKKTLQAALRLITQIVEE